MDLRCSLIWARGGLDRELACSQMVLKKDVIMHGKDACPKDTIRKITQILKRAGMSIEEVSWEHLVPHVWSVHVKREPMSRIVCEWQRNYKSASPGERFG